MPEVAFAPAEVRIVGTLADVKDYGESYRIVIKNIDDKSNYLAWINSIDYELLEGDKAEIQGVVCPPQYEGSIPDELTNRRFLIQRKISAEFIAVDTFKLLSPSAGTTGWPRRLNRYLANHLQHVGLTQISEQFLQAILLGDVEIDPEVRADFSRSGLSHVLALSGTHVAIIALIISILFFPITFFGSSRTGQIASLAVLWIYAVVTGLSPSVTRAVTMISFVILGKISGRNVNSINTLFAAALLILLFNPITLYGIGFQLSFLAVAGILLFMPIFMSGVMSVKHRGLRSWLIKICPFLFLPITAMIGTAPLAVYHFHLFPTWFLITNLIMAILLPLILFGGTALLIISLLGSKLPWLSGLINQLIDIAIQAGHVASEHQPSSLMQLYPSILTVACIYLSLIFIWLAWNSKRVAFYFVAAIIITGGIIASIVGQQQHPDCEAFEWKAGNSFNMLYRQGNKAYIITDAKEKYHASIFNLASYRLTDYLGKRKAELAGVYTDSLTLPNAIVRRDAWIIEDRRILFLHDYKSLSDSTFIHNATAFRPQTVVISHGFKGDPGNVVNIFPESRIEVSPSIYATRRKDILDQLHKNI